MYKELQRTLFTVGHSNRSIHGLLEILQQENIDTLVDVRSHPHSEKQPQYEQSAMREILENTDIAYHWAGRHLGGRRKSLPNTQHTALLDSDLQGFADHMDSDSFKMAATQLISLSSKKSMVMLCAERLPEQCHRSLIADYLTLQGVQVIHLIDPGKQYPHQLSPLARRESSELIYDTNITGSLNLN